MKAGDLVRYAQSSKARVPPNMALVIEVYPAGGTITRRWCPMVSVLWDDGEFEVHDYDEFEVISEAR